MPLTGELISGIEDKLWRAARFLEYKISLGSPDGGGRVPLHIQLAEYADAPPLDQKFSPAEEAMLRMREWLSKLDESREDMVVSIHGLTNGSISAECAVSPLSGLALVLGDPSREAKDPIVYAAVLKARLLGLYSIAGSRKLQMACPKQQLKAYLTVTSRAPETNAGPFNVEMGAGFSGEEEGSSARSPYQFALALPPVACVGLVHRLEFDDRFEGDVLIRSNATSLLKLNARTGRIIELRATGDNMAFQLHFERDAFARALQRIETDAASLLDCYDTNAALSSAVAFLAEEALASRYLAPVLQTKVSSNAPSQLPALLRQLNLANILSPLNQLLPQETAAAKDETGFSIPEDSGSGTGPVNNFMVLMGNWILRHGNQLAETRSWSWTLLREAVLVVERRSRYTEQALTEIYESSETGPLGYWAATGLLDWLESPLARKFAARGLERLSPEDFRRDCRLFLTGQSVVSQCFQKLAATLPGLSEEELASLVARHSAARAEFIRECARRLREAKGQPAFEVIAPALDAYWRSELKEQVAAALRGQAVDPVAVYERALKIYESGDISPDYAEAAKLFQQAAEAGHTGAEYYLAVLYEKGKGVPKDTAAALRWYQQSAMNGHIEAAMALGNLYGDGLAVERDRLAAFVWYSVAAAHGHKVAATLRDGLRHRLPAAAVAEGEKQVATILGR